jgi:predicted O-linked N-acetylglucosamine transferase (SPINDLY family)
VSYLGYPGTIGAEFIDYLIADHTVLPPDEQPFYTEKIVWLPHCYQVSDSTRRRSPNEPARRAVGLPEHGFVFCCFNQSYKITAPIFDIWMRLLHRIDASVLWLIDTNELATQKLRGQARARGIDPERLVFAAKTGVEDHLARHGLADLFLDTLPYNAHTTANDSLWVGVPVVTCKGGTFAGRVAASLLQAVGLSELVTENVADYESLALSLATDPSRLKVIRDRLVQSRSSAPLFDTDRFRRHIEAAYETMWKRWQNGAEPCSFAVEPT